MPRFMINAEILSTRLCSSGDITALLNINWVLNFFSSFDNKFGIASNRKSFCFFALFFRSPIVVELLY